MRGTVPRALPEWGEVTVHYLPPTKPHWRLATLHVPATWPGGARDVKVRVTYTQSRYISGVCFVWTEVTARTDDHLPRGHRSYMPDSFIALREN